MNHHLINCFLPPHILTRIIEAGTDQQREKALQTANISNQIRAHRQAMAGVRVAAGPMVGQPGVKQRVVYTANHSSNLPGAIVRQEGGPPTGDPAADEAYDGAGTTYDLYWEVYQRNSIDNNGMRLDSSVHYQKGYDNAFWNGQQMVYGDGDEDLPPEQRLFNRFTIALDVISHELTHGVTQYTSNLMYLNQPGALNESFSDVFGIQVKQRHLGQTSATSDWIIGEGLFTANVKGVGIRSMKAPGTAYDDLVLGKDPQPANMKDYVTTIDDNGGVHINSGIPNHAFYLLSMALGGSSWEKAGHIWYITLQRVSATASFQEAADLTYVVAGELYGNNSLEQQAVSTAWAGVGITVTGLPPAPKPGCLPSIMRRLGIKTG
jgi:Zn-dependent metalloprotease